MEHFIRPTLFKAESVPPLTGVLHVILISPQSSKAGGQVFARLLGSRIIPLPASPEGCWCVSRANSVKSSAPWQACRPRRETSSSQATPRTDQPGGSTPVRPRITVWPVGHRDGSASPGTLPRSQLGLALCKTRWGN